MACVVAVLKYRLYDLGRIVTRTVSYAIVTGLLVGVYAGLVLLATRVLPGSRPRSRWRVPRWPRRPCSARCARGSSAGGPRFNRARYDAERCWPRSRPA